MTGPEISKDPNKSRKEWIMRQVTKTTCMPPRAAALSSRAPSDAITLLLVSKVPSRSTAIRRILGLPFVFINKQRIRRPLKHQPFLGFNPATSATWRLRIRLLSINLFRAAEGGILVGKQIRVPAHPSRPAKVPGNIVEESLRIPASENYCPPGKKENNGGGYTEEKQNYSMRNSHRPTGRTRPGPISLPLKRVKIPGRGYRKTEKRGQSRKLTRSLDFDSYRVNHAAITGKRRILVREEEHIAG